MIRQWLLIAGLICVILSGIGGYRVGVKLEAGRTAVAIAKAQKDAFRAAEIASTAEEKRLAAEFQRAQSMIQLEDEANADEDASRLCLGADSVLRLNKR
jgi:hypothetical protein